MCVDARPRARAHHHPLKTTPPHHHDDYDDDDDGNEWQVATAAGCSVVRTYCGHGIGELFHTNPTVPHYPKNKAKGTMKPGHIFTIEPMINLGDWQVRLCVCVCVFVCLWGEGGDGLTNLQTNVHTNQLAPFPSLLTKPTRVVFPHNRAVRHVAGRVDGRDARRLPLGAVRAHDPHHRGRIRDPNGAVRALMR